MASKAAQIQMQIRENSNELNDFLKDLGRWEDDIKNEDHNIKTTRRLEEKLPPIRSKKIKEVSTAVKKEHNNNAPKEKQKRIHSYDYDAWSKFDVDAACKDSSEEDEETSTDEEEDMEELEKIEETKRVHQATLEKEKGNQLFKAGKYEAAINRYTTAINYDPTNPILYANRGMALIKTEKYGASEQDCTTALEFDPKYSKALARRATAREKLKKYELALEDYSQLLILEPNNKQAMIETERIQKILSKIKSDSEKLQQKKKTHKPIAEQNQVKKEDKLITEKRKRSNKPFKRIHIDEIGLEGEEGYQLDNSNQSDKETNKQTTNERVPAMHRDAIIPAVTHIKLEIPTTSFLFETEFKRLRSQQEEFYAYLKMIPISSYSNLFHQCIDSVISPFISILLNCYLRDGLPYHEELNSISQVQRYDMAIMFLSKSDKESLRMLYSHLSSNTYPIKLEVEYLLSLKKNIGTN